MILGGFPDDDFREGMNMDIKNWCGKEDINKLGNTKNLLQVKRKVQIPNYLQFNSLI